MAQELKIIQFSLSNFLYSDFGYPSHVICGFWVSDDVFKAFWLFCSMFYDACDWCMCGICCFSKGLHVSM